jgi:hypothetical protein
VLGAVGACGMPRNQNDFDLCPRRSSRCSRKLLNSRREPRLSEYLQSAYWRVTRNPNRATTSVHSPTPLQLLNSSKFRASEHLPRHRISGLFNASLSMPRHTSCPYCVEGLGFKVMTPCNGDFVCSSCGHRVSRHCPTFNCSCPKCNDTDGREIEIPALWS